MACGAVILLKTTIFTDALNLVFSDQPFFFLVILSAWLVGVLLVGCGAREETAETVETVDPPPLTCTATLQAGDTLRLTSSTAVADLSAADPDGTVYYVVSSGALHPLVAPEGIARLDTASFALTAVADSIQMKPVAYDARTAIPLFRHPGTYRFYRLPANAVTDTVRAGCLVEYATAPS